MSTFPPQAEPGRFRVLGVRVDALDLRAAADRVTAWLEGGGRGYVCHANVHGVMEAHRDPRVRAAYAASALTVADGMPLVWLGRRDGHAQVGRVYGPDLMLEMAGRAAARGWTCFYFGGAPGVAETLATSFEARFPGLRTAGTFSPPFGGDLTTPDADVVRRINEARPDIVWVGLGCPKQELWMATHRSLLDAAAMFGVGAAFDFHTGRKRQAPAMMQRAGLEWLFRLLVEPRRLFYRYVVYNPWFVGLVALERLGFRRPSAIDSAATTAAAAAKSASDPESPGGR